TLDGLADAAGLLDVDEERLALGVARQRHLLALDHDRRLVHLAAQPDEDVGGDVRVLGIAGQHALQGDVVLAEELGAAPGFVSDGQHAVDVRVVALNIAKLVFDELAHAGRAVDARDDGDVVSRANSAILALVPLEVPHLGRRIHRYRAHVDADFVPIGRQLADVQIVAVHVLSDLDVLGREADHLAIAAHRVAPADVAPGYFVSGFDVLAHLDAAGGVLEDRAPVAGGLRDGQVIFRLEHDGTVGQGGDGRHGPSNIPRCTLRGRPAIVGDRWLSVPWCWL